MTHCKDMKCFQKYDREALEKRFHEGTTDEELMNRVEQIIKHAVNSYTTGHYDAYQWFTNYIYTWRLKFMIFIEFIISVNLWTSTIWKSSSVISVSIGFILIMPNPTFYLASILSAESVLKNVRKTMVWLLAHIINKDKQSDN